MKQGIDQMPQNEAQYTPERIAEIKENLLALFGGVNLVATFIDAEDCKKFYTDALPLKDTDPEIGENIRDIDANPYLKNFILLNESFGYMDQIKGNINKLTHCLSSANSLNLYTYPTWLKNDNFTEEMIIEEANKIVGNQAIWDALSSNIDSVRKWNKKFDVDGLKGELAILAEQLEDHIKTAKA